MTTCAAASPACEGVTLGRAAPSRPPASMPREPRGRASGARPRHRGAAVHQRHHRRSEGGGAAPRQPAVLRARPSISWRRRGRGGAGHGAALPHRRHRRDADQVYGGRRTVYLPDFTPRGLGGDGARRGRSPTPWWCHHAGPHPERAGAARPTLPHLRALSYGGGRMPPSVIERALRLCPTSTSSTPTASPRPARRSPCSTPTTTARARLRRPGVRRRLGSVGRPLPGWSWRSAGRTGEVLRPGQTGEVYVRGEQIGGEYLRPEGAATTTAGSPPTTRLAGRGRLPVRRGPLDDMIVRGGENISPGEIEDVLLAHRGGRAAVIGMPDDEWGQRTGRGRRRPRGDGGQHRRAAGPRPAPAARLAHPGRGCVRGRTAPHPDRKGHPTEPGRHGAR